jgi:hypothetical protein
LKSLSNSRLGFHDIDDDSEAVERVARTTIAEQMKEGLVELPVSIFAEDVENQGSNVQNMAARNEGETRKDALLTWDSRYHGKLDAGMLHVASPDLISPTQLETAQALMPHT